MFEKFNLEKALEESKKQMDEANDTEVVHKIPVDKIGPNPNQPRKFFDEAALLELAQSIKEKGLLEPIIVRENNNPDSPVQYEIIAGERRWRAHKLAGISHIKAFIRNVSDLDSEDMALIENIQREELCPYERMLAIMSLKNKRGSNEDVAKAIGKSIKTVELYLTLGSRMTADPDFQAVFEPKMKDLTISSMQDFSKIYTKMQKVFSKDKREKERALACIKKHGVVKGIDKLYKKFSKDKAKDETPVHEKPFFFESDREYILNIKLPKNSAADMSLLENAEAAIASMLSVIQKKKTEIQNGTNI